MSDDPTPPPDSAASASPSVGPPGPPPSGERRKRQIGWRSRDILRAVLLVVAVLLGLRLLWIASTVVFALFLGVLLGVALIRPVDFLARFRIPRGIGAAMVVLAVMGALVAFGAWVAPTLRAQAGQVREQVPRAVDRIEQWLERRPEIASIVLGDENGTDAADTTPADTAAAPVTAQDTVEQAAERGAERALAREGARQDTAGAVADGPPAITETLRHRLGQQMGGLSRHLFPFLTTTIAALAGVLLIIVLAIYIAAEPDLYQRGLMHLFPHRSRARAEEVLHATAHMMRRWLGAQFINMMAVGAVTTITLLVLDVEAALALGVLAGLLEFIPTVGPVLAAVPAIAMALLDSPQKAVYVLLAYIVIQQLESHVLTPLIMKGQLDLPPALTIMAQAVMTILFGFLGLLVAVPLLATVIVPIKMLYVEGVIGDDMDMLGDDD